MRSPGPPRCAWRAAALAWAGAGLAAGPVLAGPIPSVDGLGRAVSQGTAAETEALLRDLSRPLSPFERGLVLAIMNEPELDAGVFKDRRSLVRHFTAAGVSARPPSDGGLAEADLWRLVRAARAAAEAFRAPAAVLLCLTFRESSFNARASAWTTSAKGLAQLTNGAVSEVGARLRSEPWLGNAAEAYARILGARMPERFEGAPDVDAATAEAARLRESGAPREAVAAAQERRRRAIASHKDEPGHIYNLETNFGIGAAYLAYIRFKRFAEVPSEEQGWLTAVAAYNQGPGPVNDLIYHVFRGPADYNAHPLDRVWSEATLSGLSLSPERRHEMLGEVDSVRRCAVR